MDATQAKRVAINDLAILGYLLEQRLKRKYFMKTVLMKLESQGESKAEILVMLAASMGKQLCDIDEAIGKQRRDASKQIGDLAPLNISAAQCLRDVFYRMRNMSFDKEYVSDEAIITEDVELLNVQAFVRFLEIETKVFEIFSEQNASDLEGLRHLVMMDENRTHLETLHKLSDDVTGRAVERSDWTANTLCQALIRKTMYASWQRLRGMYRTLELRKGLTDSDFSIEIHY